MTKKQRAELVGMLQSIAIQFWDLAREINRIAELLADEQCEAEIADHKEETFPAPSGPLDHVMDLV